MSTSREEGDRLKEAMVVLERQQAEEIVRLKSFEARSDLYEKRVATIEQRLDTCDARWQDVERREMEDSIRDTAKKEARQQLLTDLKAKGLITDDTVVKEGGKSLKNSMAKFVDKLEPSHLMRTLFLIVVLAAMLIGGSATVLALTERAFDAVVGEESLRTPPPKLDVVVR